MSRTTAEQAEIVKAYGRGDSLVVQAGAGTGKTYTLRVCAASQPRRTATYLAYNRSIKDEAGRSFPGNVTCVTTHGAAFRAIGVKYKARLEGGRMPARMIAQVLGIREALPLRVTPSASNPKGAIFFDPTRLARVVMATIAAFTLSADAVIDEAHVPAIKRIDDPDAIEQLVRVVVPMARAAWDDIVRIDGRLPFSHDCYLKLWQLSCPQIPTDVVLLDEAQDTNGCVRSIVEAQTHAQIVLVGDSCQQLYAWRGAVDAMASFEADSTLVLSQSFRFGQAIADEANKWLDLLAAPLRLSGNPALASRLAEVAAPRAVLCRTNAGVIAETMRQLEQGRTVGLVGDHAKAIRALAEAAGDLQANRGTAHPELLAFTTWAELQDYVRDDDSGSDLRVLVEQIDDRGPAAVISMCDRLVDEQRADVVVTTGHKSKGREWQSVRIASDFRAPKGDGEPSAADCMLAYVSVTRAQIELDRIGLSWVDRYSDDAPPLPVTPGAVPAPAAGPVPLRADLRSLLLSIIRKPRLLDGESLDRGRELEARALVTIRTTADKHAIAFATPAAEAEIGERV